MWCLLVKGSTGGHATGQSFDTSLLEVRDAGDVGGDDSHGVWGVHEEAVFTQHHVTVLQTETKQVPKGVNSHREFTGYVTFKKLFAELQ